MREGEMHAHVAVAVHRGRARVEDGVVRARVGVNGRAGRVRVAVRGVRWARVRGRVGAAC